VYANPSEPIWRFGAEVRRHHDGRWKEGRQAGQSRGTSLDEASSNDSVSSHTLDALAFDAAEPVSVNPLTRAAAFPPITIVTNDTDAMPAPAGKGMQEGAAPGAPLGGGTGTRSSWGRFAACPLDADGHAFRSIIHILSHTREIVNSARTDRTVICPNAPAAGFVRCSILSRFYHKRQRRI